MADQYDEYAAVVLGAGSAGITVVGNLLEQKISPILWIDDQFDAGRVNRMYREVMSNTQVWLIVAYAEALEVFQKILASVPAKEIWHDKGETTDGQNDRLSEMRKMDQNEYCELSYAADMLLMFLQELRKFPGVVSQTGWVTDAELDESAASSRRWSVRFTDSDGHAQTAKTQRLILCQGAHPIDDPLPVHIPNIKPLNLDIALSHTKLRETLGNIGPATVGLIGASHSAIIVLMNLYSVASETNPDLRIRWFTRHALRYAVQMDGWILRDTTGLKGEAARFAQENLEPGTLPLSDVSKYISKVGYHKGEDEGTFDEQLPGCKYYIQAIGYRNNEIPDLRTKEGKAITADFHHKKGSFHFGGEKGDAGAEDGAPKIPGLYGSGIAWPERVQDPHGNLEMAVGFLKFMNFVKKEIGGWD